MNSYEKRVRENLEYMNSSHADWKAVPVVGVCETENGVMPTFDFSVCRGFDKADSQYKNGNSDESCRCELCGHGIKFAYWIYSQERKETMLVGSECVTHFEEGKSGADLTKDAKRARNYAAAMQVVGFRSDVKEKFSRKRRSGYGPYTRTDTYWTDTRMYELYNDLGKLVGNAILNGYRWRGTDYATSDAAYTRFYNKRYQEALMLMNEFSPQVYD